MLRQFSRTEDGVGRTGWDVRPRRQGGSSEAPRRSSERTRDDLHYKFIKGSFAESGGYGETVDFKHPGRLDPFFLLGGRGDRIWPRPPGSVAGKPGSGPESKL
jgi:hypothetical protein